MKLYFARHGETDWNVINRTQGWTDIPLNSTGVAQAEALREKLAKLDYAFDAVYTSPLKRAYQTAEIATAGQYPLLIDDRLKERNCGEFEGKPRTLIFDCDIDFLSPEVNSGAFGVEPINTMTARVRDFLRELQAKYPENAKILIFTSNGVMLRTNYLLTPTVTPHFKNAELYTYTLDNI